MIRCAAAAALALVLLAAGCSDAARPPPQASGEWFLVNPDRWPQPAAVRTADARRTRR